MYQTGSKLLILVQLLVPENKGTPHFYKEARYVILKRYYFSRT